MRRFLITGASSGVGEALAVRLAATEATRLHLVARNSDNLQRVADSCANLLPDPSFVSTSVCDVRCEFAIDRMWDEYTRAHGTTIDCLVANAGISRPGRVEEYSVNQYNDVMDTNVKGFHRADAFITLTLTLNKTLTLKESFLHSAR